MNYVHYKVEPSDKGEVLITEIYDDYFFKNDEWHITAFNKFKQFQDNIKNYNSRQRNVFFRIKSKNLNLEFKYLFLKLIVKEDGPYLIYLILEQ